MITAITKFWGHKSTGKAGFVGWIQRTNRDLSSSRFASAMRTPEKACCTKALLLKAPLTKQNCPSFFKVDDSIQALTQGRRQDQLLHTYFRHNSVCKRFHLHHKVTLQSQIYMRVVTFTQISQKSCMSLLGEETKSEHACKLPRICSWHPETTSSSVTTGLTLSRDIADSRALTSAFLI